MSLVYKNNYLVGEWAKNMNNELTEMIVVR